MRRRPCRRSYRPAPENRSRSRSDCSSKNCCHASFVCPYKSPQKLSFISARKCWKCSLIGIIFAIGCRSPFQERLSLVRQSQLTPSRLLHNQRYVTTAESGTRSVRLRGSVFPVYSCLVLESPIAAPALSLLNMAKTRVAFHPH